MVRGHTGGGECRANAVSHQTVVSIHLLTETIGHYTVRLYVR